MHLDKRCLNNYMITDVSRSDIHTRFQPQKLWNLWIIFMTYFSFGFIWQNRNCLKTMWRYGRVNSQWKIIFWQAGEKNQTKLWGISHGDGSRMEWYETILHAVKDTFALKYRERNERNDYSKCISILFKIELFNRKTFLVSSIIRTPNLTISIWCWHRFFDG